MSWPFLEVVSHPISICILGVLVLRCIVLQLWVPSRQALARTDYLWLLIASVGIVGGVRAFHQLEANHKIETLDSRVEFAAQNIEASVEFGGSCGICRHFNRLPESPPEYQLSRDQREFDQLCAWFEAAQSKLDEGTLFDGEELSIAGIGGGPPPKGAEGWDASGLAKRVEEYNEVVREARRNKEKSATNSSDLLLAWMAPYLLAIALAIRFAKVSATIKRDRLERGA